jgi:transposase InsO family protein
VNIYPFIEAEKACRRNVTRACELLKVSRAAFYQHLAGPSRRDRADAELAEKITQIHGESRGRYGAPRVHAVLARRGHRHGRKRVARLMRSAGIAGRAPKRWRKTTIADPAAAARADLIRRDFTTDAARVNARWCGDITYIATWEGWLFLATVIDIASRRVVGFAMADHLRTELVADSLANAVAARDPDPGVVFHSDRSNTPRLPSPLWPPAARRPCRPGAPASAGTTPSLRASSPRLKASCSTSSPGPPGQQHAAPPWNTSAGTTAPGCTAPSVTAAPPNSRTITTTRSER